MIMKIAMLRTAFHSSIYCNGTDEECLCMNDSHNYARYSGNYNCVRPRGSIHFLVLMSLAGKLVLGIIMQSIGLIKNLRTDRGQGHFKGHQEAQPNGAC